MANLFVIVNSNHCRFRAFADHFWSGYPEVVNAGLDSIENLLEAIDSCSCIFDGPTTTNPPTICGSAPILESTPVPSPITDRPKTTVPLIGTPSSYTTMLPNWVEVTYLSKVDNFLYLFPSPNAGTRPRAPGPCKYRHQWRPGRGTTDYFRLRGEEENLRGDQEVWSQIPQSKGPTCLFVGHMSSPSRPCQQPSPGTCLPQLLTCPRIVLWQRCGVQVGDWPWPPSRKPRSHGYTRGHGRRSNR